MEASFGISYTVLQLVRKFRYLSTKIRVLSS